MNRQNWKHFCGTSFVVNAQDIKNNRQILYYNFINSSVLFILQSFQVQKKEATTTTTVQDPIHDHIWIRTIPIQVVVGVISSAAVICICCCFIYSFRHWSHRAEQSQHEWATIAFKLCVLLRFSHIFYIFLCSHSFPFGDVENLPLWSWFGLCVRRNSFRLNFGITLRMSFNSAHNLSDYGYGMLMNPDMYAVETCIESFSRTPCYVCICCGFMFDS